MWLVFRIRNLTKGIDMTSCDRGSILLLKKFPHGADVGCCGTSVLFLKYHFFVVFFCSEPSNYSLLLLLSLLCPLLFTTISVSFMTYFVKVVIILPSWSSPSLPVNLLYSYPDILGWVHFLFCTFFSLIAESLIILFILQVQILAYLWHMPWT